MKIYRVCREFSYVKQGVIVDFPKNSRWIYLGNCVNEKGSVFIKRDNLKITIQEGILARNFKEVSE